MSQERECPICCHRAETAGSVDEGYEAINCRCCGHYLITDEAIDDLPGLNLKPSRRTALTYAVRRITDRHRDVRLDFRQIETLLQNAELPDADQVLDEFLIWIGSHSKRPGYTTNVFFPDYKGVFGAVEELDFMHLVTWAHSTGWFFGEIAKRGGEGKQGIANCALTPKGWERYRELTRARNASRFIFMAMKYADRELDEIVQNHFAPEIAKTGLDLRRLDDEQPAGLIDDQLRVRIRTARMLICDLTHGNKGAYWEAGFAEGLGKHVIYTCRNDVFKDRDHQHHPHFDTAHLVTVPWNPADPGVAARKLKDIVRASLPLETRLEDE